MKQQTVTRIFFVMFLTLIFGILSSSASYAATPEEINASVDASLARFTKDVKGGQEFLDAAKGVLVIPNVIHGGFFLGGEYGEGSLRIGGKTIAYYNIVAGSFGYQIGAQKKDVILVFMDTEALNKFRRSEGWQVGVDGTVTLINLGVEGSIDTTKIKEPIVGFVFDQKGLMAGASIKGAKFTKLMK